ncbi:MFS transporter [Paenibacillus amylolyticus]|uniref:MFS transporter n=1 Tax=Paenibacillus amylolyticus TaxID=1451 RepID=A0A5M9WTE8_PAEAM|nr:MFS transporter [Paenibacillus amylolyticus]KAA8784885.1 MFS transporter [Paenibacillus amylolyticus]
MKSSYLTRAFYYLWTTQTAANAADVLYIMALTVMVLDRTNSLVSAALLPLIRSGAQLLSSLVAPLFIQRFKLSSLLFFSQTGQFLLFICLAVYIQLNSVESSLVLVFSLIFVMSFLDGWTTPARNALIPRLVTHEQGLLKANGLMSVSDQVVQFAGWGLSGVIVALIGSSSTLLLTAVIYGLAAAFTLGVKETTHGEIPEKRADASADISPDLGRGRWHTLTEGWKMIWKTPRLRVLTFMDMIDMLGGSIWVGAFTLTFVQVALGQGEEWWGFINAAYFAGTIGGGLLVLALARIIGQRYFSVMMIGMAGYGILTAVYALNSQPFVALILVMLMGPFAELAMINRRTLIQSSVSNRMLPKVLSAQASMMHLVFCVSLLGMAWLAEYIGIVNLYLFAAALTILAIVAGLLNFRAFQEKNRQMMN